MAFCNSPSYYPGQKKIETGEKFMRTDSLQSSHIMQHHLRPPARPARQLESRVQKFEFELKSKALWPAHFLPLFVVDRSSYGFSRKKRGLSPGNNTRFAGRRHGTASDQASDWLLAVSDLPSSSSPGERPRNGTCARKWPPSSKLSYRYHYIEAVARQHGR